MTFDPTKPVQTRDGRKARIIATDRNGSHYPIIALVSSKNYKEELIVTYLANGSEDDCISQSPLDLVNVPEERELWVNVYENGDIVKFSDKDSCDVYCRDGFCRLRLARLHIRFTVGQMDE